MAVCYFCGRRECGKKCIKDVDCIASAVAATVPFSKGEVMPLVEVATEYVSDNALVVEMLRRMMLILGCGRRRSHCATCGGDGVAEDGIDGFSTVSLRAKCMDCDGTGLSR